MSTPTLDPAPTLRKHLDAYATVSDAHRTTHKELKEYAATVEQMRALLASVQALPDAYGDRLMGEAETQRLRQEQDAMMRTLRATRRALGLGKEGRETAATPAKRRTVKGVATSEATRESEDSEVEDEGDSEAEEEDKVEDSEVGESEAEEVESETEENESVGSEDDGEATSESVRDTVEDSDADDRRASSASSEADPSSSETTSAETSSQDDASSSVSVSTTPPSTSVATASPAPTPKPEAAVASRRSKLAPPRKVASTPAATPTPTPAAEDVRILPLPTAHHRARDARLKRLKMLQARTGRPVLVSDRAEGAGGRRRRRREVRRGRGVC